MWQTLLSVPSNEVLLVLDSLAEGFSEGKLDEILQLGVDMTADGIGKDRLHAGHEDLQPFDHGDDLNQSKFLLFRVVVSRCLWQ